MKKWCIVFMTLFFILFMTACNGENNKLSGKTLEIAYPPVTEEDLGNPSEYSSIATFKFSEGNKASNTVDDTEGTYELKKDVLVINFKNKDEELNVKFIDFKESDKEFSLYSAVIDDSKYTEGTNQLKNLLKLSGELSENTPVEFIEK